MDDLGRRIAELRDLPATELLAEAVRVLDSAGARDEALGILKEHRRLGRPPVITPAGRAWRLGELLLDRDARLYATGAVTRAIAPLRGVTNRSHEADVRRADRLAASRGRFPEGETINYRFEEIPTDDAEVRAGTGRLTLVDGIVLVRLGNETPTALAAYLADRASLLFLD